MFDWLPMFFDRATSVVPRFYKCPPTERLIKWSRCQDATCHGPGIVWYWPLVTETMPCDIRWQSLVTSVQTVTLSDGASVSARTLTRWRPGDLLTAVESEADYADTVADTAQSVLVSVLGSVDQSFIRSSTALCTALTLDMQAQMREIGIEVKRCTFTELCLSPAFRLINDA